jgi:signal transduction histidine kinase/ActR/RegA family two-component response regulator
LEIIAASATSPIGPRARLETELQGIGTDGLRPAGLVVGLLFAVFGIYNWLTFPHDMRVPAAGFDAMLSAIGFAIYRACGRQRISSRRAHVVAAALAFAVLGNILFVALHGLAPLFSFYIAVLVIASAGSVLSRAWALAIGAVEVTGWALVGARILPREAFTHEAFVVLASLAAAFVVHVGRARARTRILELRAGDARRERVLQQALAEADEARRSLDRKVEDRTTALRNELEERARLEAQLRHAQKMEAVGRLAGGIAHDFNNLLTVIRMSLLTVAEPGFSADDVREALRDATDATDRAAALTHDLLAFARKQTLERAVVAVGDILGGVERMIRRVAEASIRLEVQIAPEVGEVVADRHQIEQVLLNLAINACDAMANRGTLTLAADTIELTGATAVRHRVRPGIYVRVAVSDTGTGMDEATRRAAFEPFFTTKAVGRGTGLGLAVAHGIVTQHGGEIEVDSELGVGSTFTVFLPRARGTSPRSLAVVVNPLASLGQETLLVVEDEPAVRRAVQRNLERLGYHVIAACDGEDALRIAASLPGVDLLVSDVVMPGIDGPQLACELRARWPDLPVLFVTGYSADRLARSDAVGPHDRLLEKPYQLQELARTIRGMIDARIARRTQASG